MIEFKTQINAGSLSSRASDRCVFSLRAKIEPKRNGRLENWLLCEFSEPNLPIFLSTEHVELADVKEVQANGAGAFREDLRLEC